MDPFSVFDEPVKLLDSVSFIGGGIMGEAMIRGLLQKKLLGPDSIAVAELREERRKELHERLHVRTSSEIQQVAQMGKTIVLAVKPQDLKTVLGELKGALRPEQLIISIVAGAGIKLISQQLGHAAVVRVMPNTPAQIGEGISVWTATLGTSQDQREHARTILQALGREVYVKDEKYLDMATAISGSGPAYVFLLMEAMIDAAVHLGFPRHAAYELVTETIKGSIMFAMKSGAHPAELRNMVTSPGGTTAEALYQLEKGSLRTVLSKAIWSAYERSRALGAGNESGSPRE